MSLWISVGVVVLVLLALGYRYDRKHRRLGDAVSGGEMSDRGLNGRSEADVKSQGWNAGGGMPSNGP
jgi:hypothetical protein